MLKNGFFKNVYACDRGLNRIARGLRNIDKHSAPNNSRPRKCNQMKVEKFNEKMQRDVSFFHCSIEEFLGTMIDFGSLKGTSHKRSSK